MIIKLGCLFVYLSPEHTGTDLELTIRPAALETFSYMKKKSEQYWMRRSRERCQNVMKWGTCVRCSVVLQLDAEWPRITL